MSLKTQDSLVGRHSASVVYDLDQCPSGVLDDHRNLVCTGVYGILHKLLHHGRRSLHDLSRGDHVRYIRW